jgi:ABC-2 type transport system ATP-binding protein
MLPSSSPGNIVEVRDLKKRFGVIEALRGIDLSVKQGIIYALVGPDGAGKTTLLRILAGIMTPDSGIIRVTGQDVVARQEAAKSQIGYLSQRFSLNPVLTVEENINFFASLYEVTGRDRIDRTKRLMEFSRLGNFKNRQAALLSGGMKQKLSLCCALIHTPRLLLLDEPTTGVDPISRRELWEILYDLLADEVTVLVSTPYMDEAERAGMITLIHKGRSVVTGNMSELRSRYGFSLYEIISDDNRGLFDLALKRLGSDKVIFFGDKIHLTLERTLDTSFLEAFIAESGIGIKSLRRIEPGLEDLFIQELTRVG